MPNYKTHLLGGIAAFGLMAFALREQCQSCVHGAEWLACALAGSLFPDIDIKSKGQKYFYWFFLAVLLIVALYKRYDLLIVLSVFSLLPMLVRHRGIFHKLWFIMCLVFVSWLVLVQQFPLMKKPLLFDCIFFLMGAISHLWLDLGFKRLFRW